MNSIRISLSSNRKLREDLFGTYACICRTQTDQSVDEKRRFWRYIRQCRAIANSWREKFSSRILQDKGAGVRRRWWRGWKGSGRVDACIDYLFSLLLAKGRRKGKGCEKERTSPPTFEVHLPCLEETRFLHAALLSLPTYSYSLSTSWEKVVFYLYFHCSKIINFTRPNSADNISKIT